MTETTRPTYQAIVEAAVDGTGADRGWLLRLDSDSLVVVAATGGEQPMSRVGLHRGIAGTAGFVVTAAQPAAVQVRDDESNRGAGGVDLLPQSIVAAPCGGADEIVGVIELADAPSGAFSFDDVELVSLLADIAGAALSEHADFNSSARRPEEILADLTALGDADPIRYGLVVRAIEALIG